MPELSEDDIRFVMKIDPDVEAVNKALAAMGQNVDDAGKKAGPGFFKSLFAGSKESSSLLLGGLLGGQVGKGAGGAVGGIVGTLVGGPAGAVVGGAIGGAVGHGLEGAAGAGLAAPASLASAGLSTLSHSLQELQGPLGPIGIGFDVLGDSLAKVSDIIKSIPLVGSLLGPLSDVLAGIPSIFKDITTTLVNFAAKASPGVFTTWQRALEDVQGVIGRTFVPVLEIMRDGVKLFGDVLANILPNLGEVRNALSEFRNAFGEFGDEMRSVLAEIGPTIREFIIDGLQQLAHWLAVAAKAAILMAQRLREYFGGTTGAGPGAAGARTAEGAAAAPAHFAGIEEYQKQLQTAAFQIPGTSKDDIAKKQGSDIAAILAVDEEAKDLLANVDAWIDDAKTFGENVITEAQAIGRVLQTI